MTISSSTGDSVREMAENRHKSVAGINTIHLYFKLNNTCDCGVELNVSSFGAFG